MCEEDVVMEGSGNIAFTAGREYETEWRISFGCLVIFATDNFGKTGHRIFDARIHPADLKFIEKHFKLS